MEKLPDSETKLQFAVDFMEASLAEGTSPHFKSFWEARNICLQLFKENISPGLRALLWSKYSDLSKEARRLKDILDEQSAFAVEQIEIAIKALEDEITAFVEGSHQLAHVDFSIESVALQQHIADYSRLQGELNLLNTQASRINAMRKELIRTEMRVRQKNKFFQRLSAAGDKVFPKRKELIKDVSKLFVEDVDAFIASNFSEDSFTGALFVLREEIKMLQNMAKMLTLNTHSFTHTRMCLSKCWDKIKNEDKERKKERNQLREEFKQNFDTAMEKLNAFRQIYETSELSSAEATKQLDLVVAEVRSLEHGRDELHKLRETVQEFRKPITEKIKAQEQARVDQENEKELKRRQKITDIKQEIEQLKKDAESLDAESLEAKRSGILESIESLAISKLERQEMERQLRPLRDLISEKKESSLLSMSEDDRQSLQQLREVLKQRKERRQEIKAQIDVLRKAAGSSGLDFEQAINANNQIAVEKERLEKINQGVEEVEQKIAKLAKR